MFSSDISRGSPRPRAEAPPADTVVTIREALPADAAELRRVAALDSARLPGGRMLVADVGGEVVAALPLGGGRAIADPFRHTADVVRLLELRAAQLASEAQARPRELASARPAPRPA